MNKILINVSGIQKIDTERDKMEMTTVGTIDENDDTYIVKYDEEQEPPMSAVNVTLTVRKDKSLVEIVRSGSASSCLTVERAKRNLCHYGTEFGDILMGISGHSIEAQVNDDGGHFGFCYDIDINGALASKNEVDITFRNQE